MESHITPQELHKHAADLYLTGRSIADVALLVGRHKSTVRYWLWRDGVPRDKDAKTETMLGYSKGELRTHLEAQFRSGMSWENRSTFHVDHIIPIAWFIKNRIHDPAKINALSNLQVLTPCENRRKSAHFGNGPATYTAGLP